MQEFAVPPLQGMMQIMLWKGLLNRTNFFSNHIFELYYENCSDFILVSGFVCLCWGFTAQSTQWGHVERGQFS